MNLERIEMVLTSISTIVAIATLVVMGLYRKEVRIERGRSQKTEILKNISIGLVCILIVITVGFFTIGFKQM